MKDRHERVREAQQTVAMVSTCPISIEQAISTALLSVGGTVFEAKLKEVERLVVWKVKLVSAGQRIKVYIDAHSGRVLDAKAEVTIQEPSQSSMPSSQFPS
jgi:uncharacterized membrane protein YkoI